MSLNPAEQGLRGRLSDALCARLPSCLGPFQLFPAAVLVTKFTGDAFLKFGVTARQGILPAKAALSANQVCHPEAEYYKRMYTDKAQYDERDGAAVNLENGGARQIAQEYEIGRTGQKRA